MSPISREREYERRRYEKWQGKLATKRQKARVRRQRAIVAGSALAVVLVIAGAVFLLTRGDDTTPLVAASPSPSASSPSASSTTSPSASPSGSGTAAASPAASAGSNPCPTPTVKPGPAQSFAAAPAPSLAEGKAWTLTITTTCGDIVARLDGAKAPKAVASAIFLSGKKFWDGSACHRLGSGSLKVLQCGDPTGTGGGGPGYQFGPVENAPTMDANKLGLYKRGVLAMARAASPDSNGSQFFIVFGDTQLPGDTGGYTVFGEVTKGLDIVDKVAAGGVAQPGQDGSGPPARAISIVSTSVTPA